MTKLNRRVTSLFQATWLIIFIASTTVQAQDFPNLGSLKQIINTDFSQLEDSLVNRGFVFDKSEGLIFKYKKSNSSFEFQISPKEITYIFSDRSLYFKINSELGSGQYTLVRSDDTIKYNTKNYPALLYQKENLSFNVWSIYNESDKKTMYAVKLRQGVSNVAPQTKSTEESAPKRATPPNIFSFTPKPRSVSGNQSDSLMYPKARLNLTLAAFRYYNGEYSETLLNPKISIKRSTLKKSNTKKNLGDVGKEVYLSWFADIHYAWISGSTISEYIILNKFYLGFDQYYNYDLKAVNVELKLGIFANYTRGVSTKTDESAGFITSGIHIGEQVQRKIGKARIGAQQKYLGFGFDQFISIKGGYIGSCGLTLGF